MNRKRKIYDEVLKMFGIPHTKESPWYQDRFDKFNEIVGQEESPSPAPVDDVVKVMAEFKEEKLSDRCFSVYGIRKLLNLLLGEEISMSRFAELLNERASRQPEIDALKKRVEELEADNDKLLNLCRRKY